MTTTAIQVLAALLLAHFLGDFTPLATPGMQKAKAVGRPVGPIAAHALVHGVLVGLVVWIVARPATAVLATAAAAEFGTHLAIDWTRGRVGALRAGFADPSTQAFWSLLGLDQMVHGLVLVWIASMVV